MKASYKEALKRKKRGKGETNLSKFLVNITLALDVKFKEAIGSDRKSLLAADTVMKLILLSILHSYSKTG